MENKKKRGAPKKEPTFKPSLRCSVEDWSKLKDKYPGQVNKMFNEWVKANLNK